MTGVWLEKEYPYANEIWIVHTFVYRYEGKIAIANMVISERPAGGFQMTYSNNVKGGKLVDHAYKTWRELVKDLKELARIHGIIKEG